MNVLGMTSWLHKLLAGIGVMMLCADAVCPAEIVFIKNHTMFSPGEVEVISILDAYEIPDKGVLLWCEGKNISGETVYGVAFQNYNHLLQTWWILNEFHKIEPENEILRAYAADISMLHPIPPPVILRNYRGCKLCTVPVPDEFNVIEQENEFPRGYVADIVMVSQEINGKSFFLIENDETLDTKYLKNNPCGGKAEILKDSVLKITADDYFCFVLIKTDSKQDPFWGFAESLDAGNTWRLLIFWDASGSSSMFPVGYKYFGGAGTLFCFHIADKGEVFYILTDDNDLLYMKQFHSHKESI